MKHRKAEGTGGSTVYVLIILIAVFILIYILVIPPEDRNALLNITSDDTDDNNGNGISNKTLFLESPGLVYPSKEGDVEHEINQLNLFIKTEPEIVTLANSLYVSKSLFNEQAQKLTFGVDDMSNLKNVILTFNVVTSDGRLVVKLNGNVVSDTTFDTGQRIITLPLDYIKEKNTLEFSANSPGIAFWDKNQYKLDNIVLKKEFELVNSKEERWFTVSKSELDILKKSILRYFLYCTELDDTTRLKIFLNDQILSSEVIPCVSKDMSVEIDENLFEEGRNKLVFSIDDGEFLINDIRVVNELKEALYKVYYFDVDSDDYDDLNNEDMKIVMKINLDNDGKSKEAEIRINDRVINLDTKKDTYSKEIPASFFYEGENIIKILPETEFEINLIKITLEEK